MDFSPDKIRARFHELTAEREKIDAKLNPAWEELNAIVAGDTDLTVKQAREREAELRKTIRALQDELSPIEMERATCSRALGGKTGKPG